PARPRPRQEGGGARPPRAALRPPARAARGEGLRGRARARAGDREPPVRGPRAGARASDARFRRRAAGRDAHPAARRRGARDRLEEAREGPAAAHPADARGGRAVGAGPLLVTASRDDEAERLSREVRADRHELTLLLDEIDLRRRELLDWRLQ